MMAASCSAPLAESTRKFAREHRLTEDRERFASRNQFVRSTDGGAAPAIPPVTGDGEAGGGAGGEDSDMGWACQGVLWFLKGILFH